MNDKKERVYSEEDLCEYTILQKIDELEKQLKNIKNEFNDLYETKEAANAIHVKLRQSDAKINNRIDGLYNITPTDVGVKDNKLGLLHDTTWLTNQGAINLDGFTYDEATKTLKVNSGGGGGSGFTKYKIEYKQINVKGKSGEHTYTIGEEVGFYSGYLTPPSDFNDGVCVLLGISCTDIDVGLTAVNKLSIISGDNIYYIAGVKIKKINEKYFMQLGAYTINSGTATSRSTNNSFASVIYAWIYK